jgi:hypothetical protein
MVADIEVTLSMSALGEFTMPTISPGCKPANRRSIWVGYKDAMDSIAQYQISANAHSIYTQSNAIEESYITNCACTEEVKRAEVFSKTRHEDVWNGTDTRRTGAIFEINDAGTGFVGGTGLSCTKTIPIKIDFRRFLPLSGIRYLPDFAGNIQLKVQFSPDGLVYCPLSPQYHLGAAFDISTAKGVTNRFMPLGVPLTVYKSGTAAAPVLETNFTIVKRNRGDFKVTSCESYLWCFGLNADIYEALCQRYTQGPLNFPIQTTSWENMNGSLNIGANKTADINI